MAVEPRRFVQVIDLYTRHPAELERALNRWRASSLTREHLVGVEVGRDAADDEHLVLEIEYEPTASGNGQVAASPDAEQVVALLDRPPLFRS